MKNITTLALLALILVPGITLATYCPEPPVEPPVVEEKSRQSGSISPTGVTKLLGCELSPTEVAQWWNAPYWHDVFLQNLNYQNFGSLHHEWTAPAPLPWVQFPELFPQCQPEAPTMPVGTTSVSTPEYDAFVKAQDEYNPVSPCLSCK
jgi:hypothetical protein